MSSDRWQSGTAETGMLEKWLLLTIEMTINKGLELNPDLSESFRQNAGKVVAIKARDPFYSLYMVLRGDTIRLVNEYHGRVDARLRVQSKDLVWFFIGPDLLKAGYVPNFQAVGDESLIQLMMEFAVHWDFWEICRGIVKEWLPEFETVEVLFEGLKRKDPVWVAQLEQVPELVERMIAELKNQSELQQQQLTALINLEKNVHRQQLQLLFVSGMVLVMMILIWLK